MQQTDWWTVEPMAVVVVAVAVAVVVVDRLPCA